MKLMNVIYITKQASSNLIQHYNPWYGHSPLVLIPQHCPLFSKVVLCNRQHYRQERKRKWKQVKGNFKFTKYFYSPSTFLFYFSI